MFLLPIERILRNIVDYRKAAGISQQKMARELSVCLRQYQDIEAGRARLDLERLLIIVGQLKTCPIALLLGQEPDDNPADTALPPQVPESGADIRYLQHQLKEHQAMVTLLQRNYRRIRRRNRALRAELADWRKWGQGRMET